MARRKLIYTDYYPYHITARSNNKEWFYIDKHIVWNIFVSVLNNLADTYGLRVHAFVLMSNHYHLLATCSDHRSGYDLGRIMQQLQQRVSKEINKKAQRVNHVFGGPYNGSLISTPTYYRTVLKYVYRNPVAGGLCEKVESYYFSSLNNSEVKTTFPYNIDCLVPYKKEVMLPWLNLPEGRSSRTEITKGLLKTEFKPVFQRPY